MSRLRSLVLVFLSFLLLSCSRNHDTSCYESVVEQYSIRLNFKYPHFLTKIKQLTLSLYNEEGKCIRVVELDKSLLEVEQGVSLGLPLGNYTAVCWANVFDNTSLLGVSKQAFITDMLLTHSHLQQQKLIETSDPLYYGRLAFRVLPGKGQLEEVHLKPAHITLQLGIMGLNLDSDKSVCLEVEKLYTSYNYQMKVGSETATYYPKLAADSEDKKLLTTRFHVLRFEPENSIWIHLYDSDQNLLASISLQDFIREHNISIEDKQEILIPLFIRFDSDDLSISPIISMWEEEVVYPDI